MAAEPTAAAPRRERLVQEGPVSVIDSSALALR